LEVSIYCWKQLFRIIIVVIYGATILYRDVSTPNLELLIGRSYIERTPLRAIAVLSFLGFFTVYPAMQAFTAFRSLQRIETPGKRKKQQEAIQRHIDELSQRLELLIK